jgi:hypothetical protein
MKMKLPAELVFRRERHQLELTGVMPSVRSRTAFAAPLARLAPAHAATGRPEWAVVTAGAIRTERTAWARTICAIARLAASHVRSVLWLRRRDGEQHPDADDSGNDESCQHGNSPINVVGKSAICAHMRAKERGSSLRINNARRIGERASAAVRDAAIAVQSPQAETRPPLQPRKSRLARQRSAREIAGRASREAPRCA